MMCAHFPWMGRASAAALPALFLVSLALAGAPAPRPETSGPDTPENQIASLGSFRFESGEIIDDLKVSYVTYGKLNAARDNAVLSLQHFAGDHHDNEFLTGPGKALDPGKILRHRHRLSRQRQDAAGSHDGSHQQWLEDALPADYRTGLGERRLQACEGISWD